MGEGVVACDADHRVLLLNAAAARLLQADARRAPGRTLQEVVRSAPLQRLVAEAASSAAPVEREMPAPGEPERWLAVTGSPLPGGAGTLLVLADVSRLKRLETMRRDFVANVSHEIKTPVTSIQGFVETLLSGRHDAATTERFLGIVARQVERLDSLVDDLLVLSRLEADTDRPSLRMEAVKLAELLRSAVEACRWSAETRRVGVEISCEEGLVLPANARLLEQAVVNLLDNAIKYSEPGGSVGLAARMEGDSVTIRVEDHGCGIEPEHLPRLFERFYRADKARSRRLGGTGLGLAIVKHVAQAHGGRVEVDSTPGRGSAFTIVLPRR